VISDDLNEPIEDGRSFSSLLSRQLLFHMRNVGRMAKTEPRMNLSNGLIISQEFAGPLMVSPDEDKNPVGRAEPAAKDVIERVEVPASERSGD
jgi:hypothetical protein